MPEFEKSTGYKMKGFGGFGNSPLKAKKKTSSTQDKKPGIIGQDTGIVKKDSKLTNGDGYEYPSYDSKKRRKK